MKAKKSIPPIETPSLQPKSNDAIMRKAEEAKAAMVRSRIEMQGPPYCRCCKGPCRYNNPCTDFEFEATQW